jgi:hypothetical protein
MTLLLQCSMNGMRASSRKVNLTDAETMSVLTQAKNVIYPLQLGEAVSSDRFGGSSGQLSVRLFTKLQEPGLRLAAYFAVPKGLRIRRFVKTAGSS